MVLGLFAATLRWSQRGGRLLPLALLALAGTACAVPTPAPAAAPIPLASQSPPSAEGPPLRAFAGTYVSADGQFTLGVRLAGDTLYAGPVDDDAFPLERLGPTRFRIVGPPELPDHVLDFRLATAPADRVEAVSVEQPRGRSFVLRRAEPEGR